MLSSVISKLLTTGWSRVDASSDTFLDFNEILRLREECATEFFRLARGQRLKEVATLASGQSGFTADGNESRGSVHELRSHLLLQPRIPLDHPFTSFKPDFYGDDTDPEAETKRLLSLGERLGELLDKATISLFEALEKEIGLPYGSLAAPVAMGERLLRFQWYPPVPVGKTENIPFRVNDHTFTVRGVVPQVDAGQSDSIVRVSPHIDIGHWTWQILATDAGLRLFDHSINEPFVCAPGPWLYTNSCSFMEQQEPRLAAPVHWVDLDETSFLNERLSISYFVHARPTVPLPGGQLAGSALFEELSHLGYVQSHDVNRVRKALLDGVSDNDTVSLLLDWEEDNVLPKGFSVGVARYYERDFQNIIVRRKAAPHADF